MTKLVLTDLTSLTNEASALATLKANNAAIVAALENTVSRDGTNPNTMSGNVDMNSQRLINLPPPVGPTEPLRFQDVTNLSSAPASANAAAISATNAQNSATAAATSATNAQNSYNSFRGVYFGAQASPDPILDPNGAALRAGDFYFNTTTNRFRAYNGATWSDMFTQGSIGFTNTIAGLRATNKTAYTIMIVYGYYAAGDCHERIYFYDSTDTTTADNNGSVIVGSDGGRWKITGQRVWTCKMFGCKDDGTDQATNLGTAISAAQVANVPLVWDGNFSVSTLVVQNTSAHHWIGKGGLIGIATAATDAILQLINCTDITIEGRFVINGNYNTNYTYGLHGYTNAASQSLQYLNFTNVIFNACKIAWAFGSTGRPDDTISEINLFGGRTYGCPGIGIGIGKNVVVNTHGCTWQSDFGTSPAGWSSVANTGVEAKGSTININGGELLYVLNTTGALTAVTGLTSTSGNVYGNINIKDAVIECSNILASTSNGGATSPTGGSIFISGCRMVFTTDTTGGAIQTDAAYPGRVTVVGNSGFASVVRTQWNISGVSNTTAIFTTDMQSFGVNCLQGYNGLNGGAQVVVLDGDQVAWTSYTPTITAQTGTITTTGSITGRYARRGKSILVQVDCQITTAGTAAQAAQISLPFNSRTDKNYIGTSYEYGLTGKSGACTIIPSVNGANQCLLRDSTGATYFANGAKFTGQVEYEIP